MKQIFLLLLCLIYVNVFPLNEGYHKHDGFFFSANAGYASGVITMEIENPDTSLYSKMIVSGLGAYLDLKIGYAVFENAIVSFDMQGISVNTTSETENPDGTSSNKAHDGAFCLGLTYYLMPQNIFANGTIGMGAISMGEDGFYYSDYGLSTSAKLGREWWVSHNWGLGISAGFGYIRAEGDEPVKVESSYNSFKLFCLFNTTFN